MEDAQKIKDIEKVTNHDVKAVEYLIKEKMESLGLEKWLEFVPWSHVSRHQQHRYSFDDEGGHCRCFYSTARSTHRKIEESI